MLIGEVVRLMVGLPATPLVAESHRVALAAFIQRRLGFYRRLGRDIDPTAFPSLGALFDELEHLERGLSSLERMQMLNGEPFAAAAGEVFPPRWNRFYLWRRQGIWHYAWVGELVAARPLWFLAWELTEATRWYLDLAHLAELLEWSIAHPGAPAERAPVAAEEDLRPPELDRLFAEGILSDVGGFIHPHPELAPRFLALLKESYHNTPWLADRLVGARGRRVVLRWSDGRMVEMRAEEVVGITLYRLGWPRGEAALRAQSTLALLWQYFGRRPFTRHDAALALGGEAPDESLLRIGEYYGLFQRVPRFGTRLRIPLDLSRVVGMLAGNGEGT